MRGQVEDGAEHVRLSDEPGELQRAREGLSLVVSLGVLRSCGIAWSMLRLHGVQCGHQVG